MSDEYHSIVVESYITTEASGKHGKVHVRPIKGEVFPQTMDVECPRSMRKEHPVGTKFRIQAKETSKEGGSPFLYSSYKWEYEVLS